MTLQEILERRRAVRLYDQQQPLGNEVVRHCIEQAVLAPTSSNMQLWEAYHVTDKDTLAKLAHACMSQKAATTAQQMVVFVTRRDKFRQHAQAAKEFEQGNIMRHSPKEKQARRIKLQNFYYDTVMPVLYGRFFGLAGLLRKIIVQTVGVFRPVVRQVSEYDVRTVVHKSCALAVQTFMLAMSEAGYDTCPLEGFDSRLVKKALHLPYMTEINMIITCGKGLPEGIRGERFRLPFDEFYHHV